MGDTDIVLQGGLWNNTYETACQYANLDFVNDVIISTWISDADKIVNYPEHENIKWVISPLPDNPGSGNMNLQIVSSFSGICLANSPVVVKMRSDQQVRSHSMNMMNRFFNKFSCDNEIEYENGLGPISPIFVIGMLSTFPYHPQDHVFWGHKEDLYDLFDIRLLTEPKPNPVDYTKNLRDPIVIGSNYYARFNSKVKEHICNKEEYLLDISPKRDEAMNLYNTMRDKVFKVFPRIDMFWIKYNSGYWYHEYEPQGEYYYDDEW
tara:strand:- start:1093 stop:1884 length:792 start_codon:yes stop_codon:yes gene_type:complete